MRTGENWQAMELHKLEYDQNQKVKLKINRQHVSSCDEAKD